MSQPVDASAAATEAVYRKVGLRLIPFLILGYIAAYLDRSNIGFAKLQYSRDLGFDNAVYGLGAGLFYLGYSLFEVPSNLLLQKIGARRTLMRVMIGWGLVSASFAFISQPIHFYVLRFLLGVAEAGFFPGVLLYLTFWAPAARRARFTAMFMSSMAVSGVIGGPLSGWIMSAADGAYGLKGWQWMFLIEAMPAIILGIIAYFYLADGPGTARWLNDAEKAVIQRDLKDEADAKGASTHVSFKAALKDPRLYALGGMAMAMISGIAAIALWLPTVLHSAGITDVGRLGLFAAIPYLVGLVAQQLVARSSDRRLERRWHAAVPAMIAATGWCLLPLAADQPWLSLGLLTLITGGCFGATGPFWSLPAAYLKGTAAAGGIALITSLGGVAAFATPIVVGWASARTGSLDTGLYLYGALMFAGSAGLLIGTRSRIR